MSSEQSTAQNIDTSTQRIPEEEQQVLLRVLDHLAARRAAIPTLPGYDQELVSLRDQISEARLEDVPALLAHMERVAGISAQRNELRVGLVDPANPYFARLRLREHDRQGTREREVLIGKTTYIDADSNVRIVDWRHAPVSQIYYRYGEDDDYEETFGDREVEGKVLLRRTVTIDKSTLLRIATPQGTFVLRPDKGYRWIAPRESNLKGGQGKATRPGASMTRGVLGVGHDGQQRLDRHLPEISALLDPRQFDLISRPDAGLVVIQGGAGSGKTTIGLHRIAFLNYQAPKKFAGDRMLVVTTSEGLVSYTSEVLPALGVSNVNVMTFSKWAHQQRKVHFPVLNNVMVTDETPTHVSRLKKHPAILHLLEQRAMEARDNAKLRSDPNTAITIWAETLTDLSALQGALAKSSAPTLPDTDLRMALRWCSDRCSAVLDTLTEERREPDEERVDDDQDVRGETGVDGASTNDDVLALDPEDEPLLLRLYQIARGPLRRGKEPLQVEHLFVDEAQDFSVADLAVLLDVTTSRRSVTFAGDTSQRLVMDNCFRDWSDLLGDLGLKGTEIEPLKIAYRSTREIHELARDVLGPMAGALPTVAPRAGAPVEMFITPAAGVAVAQVGEALRSLLLREPRATVAVLARYAEQADVYYEGLRRAEVPSLRRIMGQNFGFRPGVEVTEIREVKGLEYDYVILVDVNSSVFPADMESRHLLHVAATRAAHQLWIVASGPPSPILPDWLVDAAL